MKAYTLLTPNAIAPAVIAYHQLEHALEAHYDPGQKVYEVELLKPLYYLLDDKVLAYEYNIKEEVKFPYIVWSEKEEESGVLIDDAWGHTIKRKETNLYYDAVLIVPIDIDTPFWIKDDPYEIEVTKVDLIRDYILWAKVGVAEYGWTKE